MGSWTRIRPCRLIHSIHLLHVVLLPSIHTNQGQQEFEHYLRDLQNDVLLTRHAA